MSKDNNFEGSLDQGCCADHGGGFEQPIKLGMREIDDTFGKDIFSAVYENRPAAPAPCAAWPRPWSFKDEAAYAVISDSSGGLVTLVPTEEIARLICEAVNK